MSGAAHIPGPFELRPFGSYFGFHRDPLAFLARLSERHGDVSRFSVADKHLIFLNTPELIKTVLVDDAPNFTIAKGLHSLDIDLGEGLLTSDGPMHHIHRKMTKPAFTAQRINDAIPAMARFTREMCATWPDGGTFNISDGLACLTLRVIGDMLFGVELNDAAQSVVDAMGALVEMRDLKDVAIERIPFLARWNKKKDDARKLLDDVVYAFIRDKREHGTSDGGLDELLIDFWDEASDDQSHADRCLRDAILTMFLAGHETTAGVLSWMLWLLARNEEQANKVRAEVDAVTGGAEVTAAHMDALVYSKRFIAETMRLYPPVWLTGRRAIESRVLAGHEIPAGSVVAMSQFVIQRDARYFTAPDAFNPDRWDKAGGHKTHPTYAYFPFGVGHKRCIGEGLARAELLVVLATVVQHWRCKTISREEPRMLAGITMRPLDGITLHLERRK